MQQEDYQARMTEINVYVSSAVPAKLELNPKSVNFRVQEGLISAYFNHTFRPLNKVKELLLSIND